MSKPTKMHARRHAENIDSTGDSLCNGMAGAKPKPIAATDAEVTCQICLASLAARKKYRG